MKIRAILCFAVSLLLVTQGPALAVTARAAIDGDTLILEDGRRVRLIGIDTPEIKDEYGRNARTALRTRATKKMVQHLAIEARTASSTWVKGQELKLIYDPVNRETKNLDDYGRTLAYVCRESDNSCLAEYLLDEGYALVYRRFDFKRKKRFIDLEGHARAARKRLWQNQFPAKSPSKPAKNTR